MLCFTACGNQKETQINEESIENTTEFIINYCATADAASLEQWENISDLEIDLQLIQTGLPINAESFRSVISSWQAGVDECGALVGHDAYSYKERNGSIEVSAPAQFEKRSGTIIFVFDARDMELESLTISADMETGEILKKAGLNTLLGMGTVFSVLILIALIISLFGFIPKIQAAFTKKDKKQAEVKTEAKESAAPVAQTTQTATDDAELIAVIAAAIAASEGTTTDGFIVRSIKRRSSNKWNSR